MLLLKEGDRRITVTITFADDTLMQRLDRVADAMLGMKPVSAEGVAAGQGCGFLKKHNAAAQRGVSESCAIASFSHT